MEDPLRYDDEVDVDWFLIKEDYFNSFISLLELDVGVSPPMRWETRGENVD